MSPSVSLSEPLAVVGNLDCETRWHGAVLPRRVLERISAAATLMRYLFDAPIALWTPAPVDPARVIDLPGAPPIALHSGEPPRTARAGWGAFRASASTSASTSASPSPSPDRFDISLPSSIDIARAVNDRRFAASLADRLGLAPPGATTISSLDALRDHLARGGADASPTEQWICKAPLSAAGRDRVLGSGRELPLDSEPARALTRLLLRFGALTFEPWLARTCDLGVCAVVRADRIEQRPPHTLLTTARGGFCGITRASPPLSPHQLAQLTHTVEAAGLALRAAGYLGPFNIDAFLHRDRAGALQLRALCEINARISFGWVAAALADHHGFSTLGFTELADVPAGATVLVAPQPGGPDATAAWGSQDAPPASI